MHCEMSDFLIALAILLHNKGLKVQGAIVERNKVSHQRSQSVSKTERIDLRGAVGFEVEQKPLRPRSPFRTRRLFDAAARQYDAARLCVTPKIWTSSSPVASLDAVYCGSDLAYCRRLRV